MPTAKAAESPQSRAAKVAHDIEARWPAPLDGLEIGALSALSAAQARALVSRLCAALPSSSDAPAEVRLLTALRAVVLACPTRPDPGDLDALRRRYAEWLLQGPADAGSVTEALDALEDALAPERMAPPPGPAPSPVPKMTPAPGDAGRGDAVGDVPPPRAGAGGRFGGAWTRVREGLSMIRREAETRRMAPPPDQDEAEPRSASPPEILLGGESGAEPEATPPGDVEEETESEHREAAADAAADSTAERQWRADVTGRADGDAYEVGHPYRLDLSVTADLDQASAVTEFEGQATLLASDPDADSFGLTVQVDSDDFEIRGGSSQPLTLPRTGPSDRAGFDVVPLHEGTCALTATVHRTGNFITQLDVRVPVGDPADTQVTMSSAGRPPEAATTLQPRNITLILEPAAEGGYVCTSVGSVSSRVRLPITRDELTLAVDAVQQAMLDVVLSVDDQGRKPFASALNIPEDMESRALKILARAGARLFQQLFNHPGAGADVQRVGEWVRQEAAVTDGSLTVQVVAHDVPVPWAMLYLGPVTDGADLSWDHFLGCRHVIEQIPFQMSLSVPDQRIVSEPILSVGVNANRDIDKQFGVTLVTEHLQHWSDLRDQWRTMNVLPRSTRASVVAALADPATTDQVQYFYCHATSRGKDGNPDGATLEMGLQDVLTLADLNLDAPTTVQLESHPLVFINACESGDLSPLFYAGFVPYFMSKGARGVIGTECRTPALFAVRFAEAFFDRFLDGRTVGDSVRAARLDLLEQHRNPLGLLYAVHCDADTRIDPALTRP